MAIVSMTGYAEVRGATPQMSWVWEIRGVNNKGLDLRIRLPDGFEKLDAIIRNEARACVQRGSISVTLKVNRANNFGASQLNETELHSALATIKRVEVAALAAGLKLAPIDAIGVLAQRGVLESNGQSDEGDLPEEIGVGVAKLFADFNVMRAQEGQALGRLLAAQIDRIANLVAAASQTLETRASNAANGLRQRIAQVLEASETLDPTRLAQELALIAVRSDVSEELDRLRVHTDAARKMLVEGGAVGRKLDFLMQEFNRESNTLCSKAASSDLTAIGLELKVVIDQAREQVQNVE